MTQHPVIFVNFQRLMFISKNQKIKNNQIQIKESKKIKESDLFDCLIKFFSLSVGLTTYFNYSNNWFIEVKIVHGQPDNRTTGRNATLFELIKVIWFFDSFVILNSSFKKLLHTDTQTHGHTCWLFILDYYFMNKISVAFIGVEI